MEISNRLAGMQESPIRKLVPIAEKAKAEGKKVYHLNIGQPDIETPKAFFDAVHSFEEDILKYSFSQGLPELIHAIQKYYEKYNIHFNEDEILITNGGSEALLFALIAVADHGDEVLVPEPFYTNYNGFAAPTGVAVKPITTSAEKNFALPTKEELEKLVTPKTRAILLSNPGNPTGVVYSKEEIQAVADVAKENNIYVIADEVYREFVYDDFDYTSFGNVKEIEDRVIIVDSVSKRYSACGARIGSLASKNTELMKGILKLCQSRLCVPTLEQVGAAALYEVSNDYFIDVNKEYDKRRNIVFDALKGIEGVSCEKPRGAFYIIATLPVDNAEDFIVWLLKEFDHNGETVMLAPAEGFYATEGLGRNQARIAYILNETDLTKAMNILKVALEEYNK